MEKKVSLIAFLLAVATCKEQFPDRRIDLDSQLERNSPVWSEGIRARDGSSHCACNQEAKLNATQLCSSFLLFYSVHAATPIQGEPSFLESISLGTPPHISAQRNAF